MSQPISLIGRNPLDADFYDASGTVGAREHLAGTGNLALSGLTPTAAGNETDVAAGRMTRQEAPISAAPEMMEAARTPVGGSAAAQMRPVSSESGLGLPEEHAGSAPVAGNGAFVVNLPPIPSGGATEGVASLALGQGAVFTGGGGGNRTTTSTGHSETTTDNGATQITNITNTTIHNNFDFDLQVTQYSGDHIEGDVTNNTEITNTVEVTNNTTTHNTTDIHVEAANPGPDTTGGGHGNLSPQPGGECHPPLPPHFPLPGWESQPGTPGSPEIHVAVNTGIPGLAPELTLNTGLINHHIVDAGIDLGPVTRQAGQTLGLVMPAVSTVVDGVRGGLASPLASLAPAAGNAPGHEISVHLETPLPNLLPDLVLDTGLVGHPLLNADVDLTATPDHALHLGGAVPEAVQNGVEAILAGQGAAWTGAQLATGTEALFDAAAQTVAAASNLPGDIVSEVASGEALEGLLPAAGGIVLAVGEAVETGSIVFGASQQESPLVQNMLEETGSLLQTLGEGLASAPLDLSGIGESTAPLLDALPLEALEGIAVETPLLGIEIPLAPVGGGIAGLPADVIVHTPLADSSHAGGLVAGVVEAATGAATLPVDIMTPVTDATLEIPGVGGLPEVEDAAHNLIDGSLLDIEIDSSGIGLSLGGATPAEAHLDFGSLMEERPSEMAASLAPVVDALPPELTPEAVLPQIAETTLEVTHDVTAPAVETVVPALEEITGIDLPLEPITIEGIDSAIDALPSAVGGILETVANAGSGSGDAAALLDLHLESGSSAVDLSAIGHDSLLDLGTILSDAPASPADLINLDLDVAGHDIVDTHTALPAAVDTTAAVTAPVAAAVAPVIAAVIPPVVSHFGGLFGNRH